MHGFVIIVTQRVLVRGVDNSGDAYDAWVNAGRREDDMTIEILKEDYEDLGPWDGDDAAMTEMDSEK